MDAIFITAAVSILYTLIAVRVGVISWRIEIRRGSRLHFAALLCGLAWPLLMLILGFGTIISGSAGIYDSRS